VDQFEELFTVCHDPFQREAFMDHLLTAASEENSQKVLVLFALRADFTLTVRTTPTFARCWSSIKSISVL
jgi:hypothetical protein